MNDDFWVILLAAMGTFVVTVCILLAIPIVIIVALARRFL